MMYIHERNEWPHFKWDQNKISGLLAEVRFIQGQLLGKMNMLGFQLREEAMLETLAQDAVKTSEIEGEKLDMMQVRSSIAKRLGLDIKDVSPVDRHVDGIVDILLDATRHYRKPLTKSRLFKWHKKLLPDAKGHIFQRMSVGKWRTKKSGTMQVVSGPIGHEKIHYEAPSHVRLTKEMSGFFHWFNGPTTTDLVIHSALAHFWFVTIHPFDDGNGRIARAIADMVLARSENSSQRFYSMTAQIQKERKDYYDILANSQKGPLDITNWIEWYLNCLKRAIISSNEITKKILNKAHFWKAHADGPFNERQRIMINRLLDNFEGKLTSSKWAKITKCSQDTALRDITDLLDRHILKKEEGGGRNTSYLLSMPKNDLDSREV